MNEDHRTGFGRFMDARSESSNWGTVGLAVCLIGRNLGGTVGALLDVVGFVFLTCAFVRRSAYRRARR